MLKELNIKPYLKLDNLKKISDYLDKLEFSKVKTKYSKGTDWTALSLRGYSDDINNILKPSVLKSGVNEDAKLQDTFMRKENVMKPINEILKKIPTDFERVRFMSLKSKTTIGKHTDKVDKDIKVGKIIRLHVPVRTNDKVEFSVWSGKDKQTHKLKEGHYYFVDVTKPHAVKNNSKVNRIHLVIDCYSNDELKKLVL